MTGFILIFLCGLGIIILLAGMIGKQYPTEWGDEQEDR